MGYIKFPGSLPTFANFAALPPLATDGDTAVTLDSDTIYVFNLATTTWIPTAGASGNVTSVGLALPDIFVVSGSPVVASGTLTGALATQAANLVFAGPATGADDVPTFRALVAADIPGIAFASLTDLTSAVVPQITITSQGQLNWYTNDPLNNNYQTGATGYSNSLGQTATATMFASSPTAYAELTTLADETNTTGYVYEDGAIEIEGNAYSAPTTDLIGSTAHHVFTGAPGGNVKVNYLIQKSLFWVTNKSGGTVTLAQNSTETFNGATTIVLANNKAYQFLAQQNTGVYFVFGSL